MNNGAPGTNAGTILLIGSASDMLIEGGIMPSRDALVVHSLCALFDLVLAQTGSGIGASIFMIFL